MISQYLAVSGQYLLDSEENSVKYPGRIKRIPLRRENVHLVHKVVARWVSWCISCSERAICHCTGSHGIIFEHDSGRRGVFNKPLGVDDTVWGTTACKLVWGNHNCRIVHWSVSGARSASRVSEWHDRVNRWEAQWKVDIFVGWWRECTTRWWNGYRFELLLASSGSSGPVQMSPNIPTVYSVLSAQYFAQKLDTSCPWIPGVSLKQMQCIWVEIIV